jgi:ankyrin repeat protein
MFKALKGGAASALAAATGGGADEKSKGGVGDSKQVAELESKLKALQKEVEKKDESLQKLGGKLKKFEEDSAKFMQELQKKDAEIARLTKQLDKFKTEGTGAAQEVEAQKAAVQASLDVALSSLSDSSRRVAALEAELDRKGRALEQSAALASAGADLRDQLSLRDRDIADQESKFKARILTLRKQLEVADRKVMNAKYMSESHESLSAESQMMQYFMEAKASESDRRLQRSLERYSSLEHDLQVEKLTRQCANGKQSIKETEHGIRECYSDPLLKVPAGTAKRRQLKGFEDKLKDLRSKQKSQSEFLSQLTSIGDSNDELRSAANNNDIVTVKRLMKQGCSCNVPDKTGFSAFKYACGSGNLDVIKLMLDTADIQDEDGRMTSLILAAKNAHDDVVRLLVKRGAKVDACDQIGRTALHVAADNGHRNTVLELLDLGANIGAVDKKGNTALHYCAEKNFAPIARLLLDRGINVEAQNVDCLTAAKVAMEKKHQRLIETLAEHKKNKNAAIQAQSTVTMSGSQFEKMMGDVVGGDAGRELNQQSIPLEGMKKSMRRSSSAASGLPSA